MRAYKKYIQKATTHVHARLVGPYAEGVKVLEHLHADGWRVTRSGPYTNKALFPKLDMSRFLFLAEREIEENK